MKKLLRGSGAAPVFPSSPPPPRGYPCGWIGVHMFPPAFQPEATGRGLSKAGGGEASIPCSPPLPFLCLQFWDSPACQPAFFSKLCYLPPFLHVSGTKSHSQLKRHEKISLVQRVKCNEKRPKETGTWQQGETSKGGGGSPWSLCKVKGQQRPAPPRGAGEGGPQMGHILPPPSCNP